MSTTGISGLGTQLADYLSQFQGKQQESLSAGAAAQSEATSALLSALPTDSVTISSAGYAKNQNVLSINDVGKSTAADASYLDAYMAGTSSRLSLQNSMSSSLESGMESTMDQVNKAAFWSSPGMRTALMLKTMGSSFQQVFDDLQEMVDEQIAKAQEAKTQTAAAGEESTTAADGSATDAASVQTQAAATQVTTDTPAASVPAATGQTAEAGTASDAQAQAAGAAAPVDTGGNSQPANAQASISITV